MARKGSTSGNAEGEMDDGWSMELSTRSALLLVRRQKFGLLNSARACVATLERNAWATLPCTSPRLDACMHQVTFSSPAFSS